MEQFRQVNPKEKRDEEKTIGEVMVQKLNKAELDPSYDSVEMAVRKEKLMKIAEKVPEIAEHILKSFQEMLQEKGIDGGKLPLYLVGGRVREAPIKDNTDFDFVISAENSLAPWTKEPIISLKQRHEIGHKIYTEIEKVFENLGLTDVYEKGIFEIKGLGEKTSSKVEQGEDVMKICEVG